MTDHLTPEKRSINMSKIRATNTKPEVMVRKYLFSRGLRYRKNVRTLPGTPDIVLKKYKTVIFVNGCFWHCHEGCPSFRLPKSNVEFWEKKLKRNIERDKIAYKQLDEMGWNIIVIWECELKKVIRNDTLDKLYEQIISQV